MSKRETKVKHVEESTKGAVLPLRIAQRGLLTLPKEVRKKYRLKEGDRLTLIDLGDGILVLRPVQSEIDALANQITQVLTQQGESLESILSDLREMRARSGQLLRHVPSVKK